MATKPIPQLTENDKARFWSKTNKAGESECWLWNAGKNGDGYGVFHIRDVQYIAPRIAFLIGGNPPPDNILVLHTCDTPACVNPLHLFTGTHADNSADKVKKGRASSGDSNGARIHKDRMPRGERNGNSKLTRESVLSLREEHSKGVLSVTELAAYFGIGRTAVKLIVENKTWKHL